MRRRRLGKTEVELTEVALGTWGLSTRAYGPLDERRFAATVDASLGAGITTFDMAPLWGEGRSERVVAEVVGGRRDEVAYITRAGVRWLSGKPHASFDGSALIADVEGSLRRLQTDRIDLLFLHAPPETWFDRDESRQALLAMKRAGKLRAWGVCTDSADVARRALAADADAVGLHYNLLAGDLVHDLGGDIAVAGAGLVVHSPLAYGLLSGAWSPARTFDEDDHRRERFPGAILQNRVAQADKLRFLVRDDVKSLASAAIRFVLANALVTTVTVGARSPEHVQGLATFTNGPPYLPEDDLVRLSQVLAALGL